MALSPLLLFVFNRPEHTRKTLEHLVRNDLACQTDLYVYSDGARTEDEIAQVTQVRNIVKCFRGFKSVTLIERDKNIGLAQNICSGVSEILSSSESVIVLEDDLLTSPLFLTFMNQALAQYSNISEVFGVTGYSFSGNFDFQRSYFLPFASSWGWGTWKNKWSTFSRDNELLKKIITNPSLQFKFDLDGAYKYSNMARDQLDGKINSWAIYWNAFILQNDGIFLYPPKSYVKNIGFDGSGTNCSVESQSVEMASSLSEFPVNLEIGLAEFEAVKAVLKNANGGIFQRYKNLLKNLIPERYKNSIRIAYSKFLLLKMNKPVGKGTFIAKSVQVVGWRYVKIGNHTLISDDAWINVNKRIAGFNHISIGNYCYIGRANIISSSRKLTIKDYVMTNSDCRFFASNHVFSDPMMPYIATGTTGDADQTIGVNVWIGAGTTVLGKVIIGHGSVIGAGSVVTKDIPPFSIAVGNPCRIIKRYSFNKGCWIHATNYDEKLEKFPDEETYLSKLKENCGEIIMPNFAASRNFGDLA